jgi:hypothetical protein
LDSSLFQTKPAAIPIRMKSIVQTGAKTQFGGLKIGFSIVGYQVFMLDCVVMLDKYPTAKQIATQSKIREYVFIILNL